MQYTILHTLIPCFFFVITTELVEMEFVGTACAHMMATVVQNGASVALPLNTAMANKLLVQLLIQHPQCLHIQLMPASVERVVEMWVMAFVAVQIIAAPTGGTVARANNTAIRRPGQTMEMTSQNLKARVVEVALEMVSVRMNLIAAVSMASVAQDQNIAQDTLPLMSQLTKKLSKALPSPRVSSLSLDSAVALQKLTPEAIAKRNVHI